MVIPIAIVVVVESVTTEKLLLLVSHIRLWETGVVVVWPWWVIQCIVVIPWCIVWSRVVVVAVVIVVSVVDRGLVCSVASCRRSS